MKTIMEPADMDNRGVDLVAENQVDEQFLSSLWINGAQVAAYQRHGPVKLTITPKPMEIEKKG